MKYFLLLVFSFCTLTLFSQERRPPRQKTDSLSAKNNAKALPKSDAKKDSVSEVTIRDYKIISFARDTTFLDTTLTIQKEYKYNYLRQDDFELMSLSNIGQAYNKLGVNAERATMYPLLGAMAKHSNYRGVEDINYYNVATPMTDILFKTTLEEGQLLDAMLTFNTSRRLNFSIGYKGHRSLGKYNSNQVQSGNFTATSNYITENGRYALRAHIAAQDILSEENAGLTDKELQFESGDPEFSDRAKVDVRFDDADNKILGKRYYLDHTYKLVRKRKDSSTAEKTSLAIGHIFNYETKYYQFMQDSDDSYFGDALLSTIDDKASLKTFYNQVSLEFYNNVLGRLKGNINLFNYDYYFNSTLISEDGDKIDNRLNGSEVAIGADYEKKIGGFLVNGSFKYNLSGDLSGNILDAVASYDLNDRYRFKVKLHSSARMPNFNFLLYQSEYLNYNWQNTDIFKKERINSLEFSLDSKWLGAVSAKYTNLDNYTYFGTDPSLNLEEGLENANIKPYQEESGVSYLKVKYNKEFTLGKFALNNTFMYQAVSQDADVLNVPQLVTRNTLYFSSDVFKKAMYLQTGITFKYFSKYNMNGYNPVLGEFFVQDNEELGGYPLLDFFINARIQQTRIFLKAEHFNSLFGDYNYYSAPNYPYRDFVIRFGLVWNFFS
ncbi:putative porin [Maribacter thermophilus]|uniref:putative porin n=1 Tax=Maribacter thermophilus TaxID=1197874 RepID=UPI000640C193|nr:putative porin [Maribacter thermophilus]